MENGMIEIKLAVGLMFIAFLLGSCITLIISNWVDKAIERKKHD